MIDIIKQIQASNPGLGTTIIVLRADSRALADPATSKGYRPSGVSPVGRIAQPEDIGRAVRMLCSPDAGFVTGQAISPNGAEYVGAL